MKNREIRALIASMMLVSLVAGSLSTVSVNVPSRGETTVIEARYLGAENTETAKQESVDKEDADKKEESGSSSKEKSAKPTKSETVYAKTDGTGFVKSVTVSDQLKNISGGSKFQDISDLEDIINVKGDETFSMSGKDLVWDAAGEDICYQGTTSKELPVGIEISYKLDGKDISAPDLQGKSGHLVMRYTYKNRTSGKDKQATPFMMATGLVLDEEMFKNIVVTNGKLMSDGERNVAIGYGIPAMKDILDVEDLDIPDYFEVEADVTDYESVEGMTIATNSLFNDLEIDGFDSLEDLGSSMEELQSASSQLVSGSGELKNGIDTLLASSGTLVDGIDQLASGGDALQSGASALADGGNTLAQGNAALADGTGQLLAGTQTLASGAGQLNTGLKSAAYQTQNVLLPGVKALDDGISQMQDSLSAQLPALSSGVAELNAAVNGEKDSLTAGAAALDDGAQALADGAQELEDGIKTARTTLKNSSGTISEQIKGILSNAASGAMVTNSDSAAITEGLGGSAISSAQNVSAEIQSLAGNLGAAQQSAYAAQQGTGGTESAIKMLYSVQSMLPEEAAEAKGIIDQAIGEIVSDNEAKSAAAQQAAAQIEAAIGTSQSLNEDAGTIINAGQELSVQAAAVGEAAQNVSDAQQMTAELQKNLANAATQIEGVLNTALGQLDGGLGQIEASAEEISSNASKLSDGAAALQGGIKQVAAGVQELNGKVNDPQNGLQAQVDAGVGALKAGTSQLVAGVEGENGLVSGLNQLAQGAATVEEGSTLLSQKMGEANEGAKSAASGAAELAAGANKLSDGAVTLKDGLYTLKSGSGALISGVQQLDDGAAELNSGMIRFDKDGIQKLVDVFDGDIDEMLDKLNETLDNSRAYKSFTGISDDMDGDVKFVFITEG